MLKLAIVAVLLLTARIADAECRYQNGYYDPGFDGACGADTSVPAVMAASIIAKVARDTYMHAIDAQFTGYNFASHVGYGTKAHQKAIAELGPCSLHRLSWAPLKMYAV